MQLFQAPGLYECDNREGMFRGSTQERSKERGGRP